MHWSEYGSDLHDSEVWYSWAIELSGCRNFESEISKFLGNFDTWSWYPYDVPAPSEFLAPPVATMIILHGSHWASYFALVINRVCQNIAWCLLWRLHNMIKYPKFSKIIDIFLKNRNFESSQLSWKKLGFLDYHGYKMPPSLPPMPRMAWWPIIKMILLMSATSTKSNFVDAIWLCWCNLIMLMQFDLVDVTSS